MCTRAWYKSPKERHHLEDAGADGETITCLKGIECGN